jgi:gliding motility-associated-like protein
MLVTGLFLCLHLTAAHASPAVADSIQITGPDSLVVCEGDTVTLEVTGGSEYMWSPAGDFDDPMSDQPRLVPSGSQWYFVSDTVDGELCTDSIYVTLVSVNNILDDTLYLCYPDDTLTIRVTVTPPQVIPVWSPLDPSNINVLPNPTQARVYPDTSMTFTATVNYAGCVVRESTYIRVDSLPQDLSFNLFPEYKDPFCAGDEIYFIGANIDTAKFPSLEFRWEPNNGQIQDSVNTGNVHIVLQDTTNFMRFVNNNACLDTTEMEVNVVTPITLSVTDTILCAGEMFEVRVEQSDARDFEWMPESNLSCTDCRNPTVTVAGNVTYTVNAERDPMCPSSAELRVMAFPDDLAQILVSDSMPSLGQEVTLTFVSQPEQPPGTQFTWTLNGSELTLTNQEVTVVLDQVENTVEVTWINAFGCEQTVLRVIPTVEPMYTIPLAFTPNNDEANDFFFPELVGNIELVEMIIFNRWGQLVYEGNDPDGWDGRYNGEPAPPEVYVYIIKLERPDGVITEKGDVTLVR